MTDGPQVATSQVLLPVGADGIFYAVERSDGEDELRFGFDVDGLMFVLGELVRQGATGIATDSASAFAAEPASIPPALRARTRVLDKNGRMRGRLNLVFRPIASALGFDPALVDVIHDPVVGAQRHVLDLPQRQRQSWSDLLLVHNSMYQVLIGIDARLQIDVPLPQVAGAIRRLRGAVREPTAGTTLAFFGALVDSYRPVSVGAPAPNLSILDRPWIDAFEEMLEDVAYQEYSLVRSSLGYATRVESELRRTWDLTRRLLRRHRTGDLLRFTVSTVSMAAGVPGDPSELFADYYDRTRYLPPVVKVTSQLARARIGWLGSKPEYSGTMTFMLEGFDWLPALQVPALGRATTEVKRRWLEKSFKTNPPVDLRRPQWRRAFERYFAINLERPYRCDRHGFEIAFDDVDVAWGEDRVEITTTCCCDASGEAVFVQMMAFDPKRQSAYGQVINEELGSE